MATLRELIIKISANSQSFQSEIQRASRMGSEYYRTLQNGGRQAAAVAREQRRALAELNSQLTEIRASAAGTAGGFSGGLSTRAPLFFGPVCGFGESPRETAGA